MGSMERVKLLLSAHNVLRAVQLIFGFLILSLAAGWNSKGVSYSDLDQGDFNEAGKIFYIILSAFFVLPYIVTVLLITWFRFPRTISAQMDICGNSILFFLLFIGSILLGSALTNLGNSVAVQEGGLCLHALSAALVFNLALCTLFAVGILFAYWEYRKSNGSYGFQNSRAMSDLPDEIPT